MAISAIIGVSNLEFIRDQIGFLIGTELTNQATLNRTAGNTEIADLLDSVAVWGERFRAPEASEYPVVFVWFGQGDYDNKSRLGFRGTYQYTIDIYNSAEGIINGEYGDQISSKEATRLSLIIARLLQHPMYERLGLTQVNIVHRTILNSLTKIDSTDMNGDNVAIYRMIFTVVTGEQFGDLGGTPLLLSTTEVRIGETDKGYVYTYNGARIMEGGTWDDSGLLILDQEFFPTDN